KREVYDLLHVIRGDRIGLVAFSGAAYVQCPLTLDYAAIEMFLGQLAEDLVPVPGTDLGAAIETALSGFEAESNTDRVIILITDGEDNEGRGLSAAEKAAEQGVKIFVFGIGETSGEPVPSTNGTGGFRKDDNDRIVVSRLDEEGLRRIAQTTGGEYVKAVSGDLDLDQLYFSGIKTSTVEAELSSRKVKVYHERFQIFVFAAFCLLLLEGVLSERRHAGMKA
ncbi:MAG TPA: VWA domain-containing protein, partial [Deltaproteobacteria bacterium]|nr:VWA domain-containing protein [Deltaproteobacteria bacterium]